MTDYRDDQKANERAHRLRWYVWLAVPSLFLLSLVPWHELIEDISGILWWSFGK